MKNTKKDQEKCACRCIHEDRIARAREHQLPELENDRLSKLFKAMGDPNRLRILYALLEKEMCVCDIAAFIEVTESAVSHQLRHLRHLNLVSKRREGAILYYRLNDEHIYQLIEVALTHIREE